MQILNRENQFFVAHKRIRLNILCIIIACSLTVSCKKFIEVVPPDTSVNGINVFRDDATANAVLIGLYTSMSNEILPNGITAMSLLPALSSDELNLFDQGNVLYKAYHSNLLTPFVSSNPWDFFYGYIFKTNEAIEGLSQNADKMTPSINRQLLGEAKFIRAFCYFYIVNLYGDVPLATGTDPNVNRTLPRISKMQVYQQVVADLKDAQSLLGETYLNGQLSGVSPERARPNKWVATAMLARVYLYMNEWESAETESSKIINNSNFELSPLDQVFFKASKGNKEVIWQLQPTGSSGTENTKEGQLFILLPTGPNTTNPVYLSDTLLNSFESGDLRKTNWISSVTISPGPVTYYFPFKYKLGAGSTGTEEYSMVLRLGEQYLIRAEARTQQNKLSEAISDLDNLRSRAGLLLISNTNPSISQGALLEKILQERKVELFTEWGHRWLDLKRMGKIDAVMSGITARKGGVWNSNWALYPIPQNDLQRNSFLKQNPGY